MSKAYAERQVINRIKGNFDTNMANYEEIARDKKIRLFKHKESGSIHIIGRESGMNDLPGIVIDKESGIGIPVDVISIITGAKNKGKINAAEIAIPPYFYSILKENGMIPKLGFPPESELKVPIESPPEEPAVDGSTS